MARLLFPTPVSWGSSLQELMSASEESWVLLCLACTFQRERDLPRVKSRPPCLQIRAVLRHRGLMLGGAQNSYVSLTIGRGAVFSLCQAPSVKFREGSDIGYRGEGGIYGVGID